MKKKYAVLAAALTGVLILSTSFLSSAAPYTVVKGDSLWKIAKEQLGDGTRYGEIFEANKDKIKNPDKISVGQVLEIPGGVPSAPTDETTPSEDTGSSETIDFETILDLQKYAIAGNFDTLGIGESDVIEDEGLVYTITKAAENVMVTDFDITEGAAANSNIEIFTYKTDIGYQLAISLTGKDGWESYAIYYISEDMTDADLIYLSTGSMSGEKERVQISDILAGVEGCIEITPEGDTVTLEYFDAAGNPTAFGYIYSTKEGSVEDTKTAVMAANGDMTMVDYTMEAGENHRHTVKMATPDTIGILSYETDADGNVIMDSISYEPNRGYDDFVSGMYENSIKLFDSIEIGQDVRMNYVGVTDTYRRVSDNAIVEKIYYKDKLTGQSILMKSPEGLYLELQRTSIGDGVPAIAFFVSEDGGKTLEPVYISVVDDSLGEVTFEVPMTEGETYILKVVTSENPDGSKTKKATWMDEEENVIEESLIQISEDSGTITAQTVYDDVTFNHSFVRSGSHVTTTLDTGKGSVVIEHDMDGDEIVTDSVNVKF